VLEGEAVIRAFLEPERAGMFAVTPDELGAILESLLGPEDRAVLRAEFAAYVLATKVAGLADGVDGWVDDDLAFAKPWGFDVASCRVPVVLAYGRQDQLVPAAHGDWLAAHVPGAEVWVDDGTGHMGDDAQVERDLGWLAGKA